MKTTKRSLCPISSALDLLGDKWSLLIVRDIAFRGKKTFKEFLASDERIATNVLSDRLSRLEAQGILSRHESERNRVVKVYRLTRKGLDLLPLLLEVVLWSDTYLEIVDEGRALAEAIRKDREGLLARLNEAHLGSSSD